MGDVRIPGLGTFVEDAGLGWYRSAPMPVAVLGGQDCSFILDGYDDDPRPSDFADAITRFRALDRSALDTAAGPIFDYYRDIIFAGGDDRQVVIDGPDDVLDHVRLGTVPVVSRDDDVIYVSLECECDWEPEHGLQIVFRGGTTVSKVGPYDGHVTNSPDEIYRSLRPR